MVNVAVFIVTPDNKTQICYVINGSGKFNQGCAFSPGVSCKIKKSRLKAQNECFSKVGRIGFLSISNADLLQVFT